MLNYILSVLFSVSFLETLALSVIYLSLVIIFLRKKVIITKEVLIPLILGVLPFYNQFFIILIVVGYSILAIYKTSTYIVAKCFLRRAGFETLRLERYWLCSSFILLVVCILYSIKGILNHRITIGDNVALLFCMLFCVINFLFHFIKTDYLEYFKKTKRIVCLILYLLQVASPLIFFVSYLSQFNIFVNFHCDIAFSGDFLSFLRTKDLALPTTLFFVIVTSIAWVLAYLYKSAGYIEDRRLIFTFALLLSTIFLNFLMPGRTAISYFLSNVAWTLIISILRLISIKYTCIYNFYFKESFFHRLISFKKNRGS